MGKQSLLWAALLLGAVVWSQPTTADAVDFRCENKFVHEGHSTYDVLSRCGEPAFVSQHVEQRRVSRIAERPCNGYGRSRSGLMCQTIVDDVISVQVEDWTYDFGPDRLIQYLRFEQGKLVHIESGGYGHER